ncbi:MAG: hypothetical protein M3Z24_10610, partial [Chloroflexota bacterium]|nr:hypothetical protein [Chloroflexota bacterium]
LYLQQWWVFRLTFALGRLPCFPEAPFVSLWVDVFSFDWYSIALSKLQYANQIGCNTFLHNYFFPDIGADILSSKHS